MTMTVLRMPASDPSMAARAACPQTSRHRSEYPHPTGGVKWGSGKLSSLSKVTSSISKEGQFIRAACLGPMSRPLT